MEQKTIHEKPAEEIIDFVAKRREYGEYAFPSELDDVEVVERFLSRFSHPSANPSSEQIGGYVQTLLSDMQDAALDEEQLAWRDRIMGLMINIDALDDTEVDEWLKDDTPLKELYRVLRKTGNAIDAKGMVIERKALRLLLDLRAGVLSRNEANSKGDERWMSLINKLTSKADTSFR